MDRADEDKLRKNHVELSKSLQVDEEILDTLFQEGIVNQDDIFRVKNLPSGAPRPTRAQANTLLGLLPGRGRTAFQAFLKALKASRLSCNKDLEHLLRTGRHMPQDGEENGGAATGAPREEARSPQQESEVVAAAAPTADVGHDGDDRPPIRESEQGRNAGHFLQ